MKAQLLLAAVLLLAATYSLADEPQSVGGGDDDDAAASSVSTQITVSSGKNDDYNQETNDNAYEPPQKYETSQPYKSSEKSSPYGAQSHRSEELAQPLPDQQSRLLTLNEIYQQPTNTYGSAYGSNSKLNNIARLQVLYKVNFERDFDQINPRLNTSQWHWENSDNSSLIPSDNAAFVRHPAAAPAYGKYGKPSPYGTNKNSDTGYLEMISVPFSRTGDRSNPNADPYDEAEIITRNIFNVGTMQRILFRLKFGCKIINGGQHPFPSTLVANPWDDLRPANCALRVEDNQNNGFAIVLTNEGVWAEYFHYNITATDLSFVAKRRIGVRNSYNAIVDGGIEYDSRLNAVNWYLNGYRVWSVSTPGAPPASDGTIKIDRGNGTSLAMYNRTTQFDVRLATSKCLDESDPNNPNSQQRLVALLQLNNTYYGQNDTFYDPNDTRTNVLFGQGAIMRLDKLLVLRADSVAPPPPQPLPAVYGSSSSSNTDGYSSSGGGNSGYQSYKPTAYETSNGYA